MNYQLREVTKTPGQFSNDDAACNLVYLGIRDIEASTTSRGGTPKGSAPGLVDTLTCPYFCYLFLVDFRRVVVAS